MMTFNVVLIISILTLAMAVVLLDAKLFLIQWILFPGLSFMGEAAGDIIGAIQILFGLYVLFQAKKAIDCHYILVMEKTHLIPRRYTKDGFIGGDFSWFKKSC